MAGHRVTVAIVTHNRRREVLGTVDHARTLPGSPPVVVVDNASDDGTVPALRASFPEVELIRSPANLGAAARNLAIARASTPYVALSDDDTRWTPGSLERSLAVLDAHAAVAVVCARVVVGHARVPDPTSAVMAASPLPAGSVPLPRLLGFMAGASVVRRQAFLQVGGFCPQFFLGGEEELLAIDLCARGWELVYLDEAVVEHFPSTRRDDRGRRRLIIRNALWTTWLRWPARAAVKRTIRLLVEAQSQGALCRTVSAAAAGAPWAMSHRKPVRGQLAAELLRLHQPATGR